MMWPDRIPVITEEPIANTSKLAPSSSILNAGNCTQMVRLHEILVPIPSNGDPEVQFPPANWSAATGSEGEFEFPTFHCLPMMIKSQCLDRSCLIKCHRIHFLLMMSKEAVSGPESPPAVWSALRISPGCILHLIRAGQGLFGHHHQRSKTIWWQTKDWHFLQQHPCLAVVLGLGANQVRAVCVSGFIDPWNNGSQLQSSTRFFFCSVFSLLMDDCLHSWELEDLTVSNW